MDEPEAPSVQKAPEGQKGKKTCQILGSLIAMLGALSLGLGVGWSSPAETIIKNNTEIKRSKEIADTFFWTSSLLALGAMTVMFPVAFLLDRLGRKVIMLTAAPIISATFLVLGLIHNEYAFMVSRFFLGFAGAAFCVCAPIYVGEVCESSIRGAMGVCYQLFFVIGIASEYTLGLTQKLEVLGIISAIFPMIFFILFLFMPETAFFLLMKDRKERAAKSLQCYRGKKCDITTEMTELEATVEEMKSKEATYKDLVKTKAVRKSLVISLGLMIFQQTSGINVIMFYATAIFESSGSSLSSMQSGIILGIVQIVGTLISTGVIDRLGRKLLLIVSFFGNTLCLCAQGGWFIYLDSVGGSENVNKDIAWIPILILCVFLIFFSLGAGPIPWAMLGEIFPSELKGMCGSIAGFVNWGCAFLITITFYKFNYLTPKCVPFFIYALFCALGVVFCIFIVIETRGKSLEEIQNELAGES